MSRDAFLNNIRQKLNNAHLPDAPLAHPGSFTGYSWQPDTPQDTLVNRFKEELEALKGHVHLLEDVEETADTILQILDQHNSRRILSWDDDGLGLVNLRQALMEQGVTIEEGTLAVEGDGRKATLNQIDDVFVGLTGAHGALADVGAIALLSGAERGRLASLAPPVHIALLRREQIYPSLPAFLTAVDDTIADSSNLIFIAGPSRTGDIEMTLSIGVHGPGEVHVIVVP